MERETDSYGVYSEAARRATFLAKTFDVPVMIKTKTDGSTLIDQIKRQHKKGTGHAR